MAEQKTKGSIAVIGLALFAMFFGAGNLIFPPYLGFRAGENWLIGFLAFVLVDVGMACVAVFSMSRGDGTISSVTGIIGEKMGILINTAIIVCIGPLLALPRTAATTYEMAVAPALAGSAKFQFVFYLLFFLAAFLLTVRKSKVVDIVGKILTPVMVVALVILIVQGIISPIGLIQGGLPAAEVAQEGIVAGYQTMDTLAALVFAIIIISSAREKGYVEKKDRDRAMIGSCLVAGGLLAAVYGGLTYLGATVAEQYSADITQAKLLTVIIETILGQRGMMLLGVIVGLACMTTAIGLISSTSAYFEGLLKKKIKYEWIAAFITVLSFAVANFGLSAIIQIASPILSLLYPVVVTLIVCSFFPGKIRYSVVPKAASLAAFAASLILVLESMGMKIPFLSILPFYEMGLAWLLPAFLGGIAGACILKARRSV